MDAVDFRNLIGRVGRIEYNLYGNVFLVSMKEKVKEEKFEELLKEKVPEQKLSIESGLTNAQKKSVVQALLEGKIEFDKHSKSQSEESYTLMRKFSLILLRDITKGRNSLVGMHYPTLDANGNVSYDDLMDFLEQMCRIFKWEKYERQTLGRVSKKTGKHGVLRWYAVILIQWIQGTGLSHIMNKAIEFKQQNPDSGIQINGKQERYNDSREHRNMVIADTLEVIR